MKRIHVLLIALISLAFIAASGPIINRIQDLTNVKTAATPTSGDVLTWNSTLNKWTNSPSAGGGNSTNFNGINVTNNVTAATFNGNGSGLSNVNVTVGVGIVKQTNNTLSTDLRDYGQGGFPQDTNLTAYFANITTLGGTITQPQKEAIIGLYGRLRASGAWAKMGIIAPYGGNDYLAGLALLKFTGYYALTNHGFVAGDFSPVFGYQGDGSSKYLDSDYVASVQGLTTNNMCWGYYSESNFWGGIQLSAGSVAYMGYNAAGAAFFGPTVAQKYISGMSMFNEEGPNTAYYYDAILGTNSARATTVPTGRATSFSFNGSFFLNIQQKGFFVSQSLTADEIRAVTLAWDIYHGDLVRTIRTNGIGIAADSVWAGTGLTDTNNASVKILLNASGRSLAWPGVSGSSLYEPVADVQLGTSNGRKQYIWNVIRSAPSEVIFGYGINDDRSADTTDTPANFQNQLVESIGKVSRAAGLPVSKIYVNSPTYRTLLDSNATTNSIWGFVAACKAACDISGATYIPVFEEGYRLTQLGTNLVNGDGIHPNDAGHALLAKMMLKAMGFTTDFQEPVVYSPLITGNQNARVGGVLQDYYTSTNSTHTDGTFDDLLGSIVRTNAWSQNGDKISAHYFGTFIGHATATRDLRIVLGAITLADGGATINSAGAYWEAEVLIFRTGIVTGQARVKFFTPGSTLSAVADPVTVMVTNFTLGNLWWTNNTLKIQGAAAATGAASGDIIAKGGVVRWEPANP